MTRFLYDVLANSGAFKPEIISLATSSRDRDSVRITSPGTWGRGPAVSSGETRGVSYVNVGARFSELEFQRYQPRAVLTRLLAAYDLVQFVVGTPAWAFASGLPAPLLWTATTVWSDRASRVRQAKQPRRFWYKCMTRMAERREREALKNSRFVFALSKYTLNRVNDWVAPEKSGLAVCGIDTALFHPGSGPGRDYILSVGRFSDARKNVRLLLTAYDQMAQRRGVPELYLVGELPTNETMAWARTLRIADRIQFLGVKQGKDLADLYRNARLYVSSSDEEGLGIVILEAMACGLPVVSTRCGGPETSVTDGVTGLLTPVGDAAALSAAMEQLLEDEPTRRRMGQAAAQEAVERFSTEAAGKVFLDKYKELLSSRT